MERGRIKINKEEMRLTHKEVLGAREENTLEEDWQERVECLWILLPLSLLLLFSVE